MGSPSVRVADRPHDPYAITVSSPCILALQRSLQGWRGLARVVCLPGYPLPRDISWTVVPLYSRLRGIEECANIRYAGRASSCHAAHCVLFSAGLVATNVMLCTHRTQNVRTAESA